ncbi:small GTP-binding protein domain [Spizellomyces punctatus DAOM BR117]|uniref:Small GTP-binding protein domain n=1 Tax=Spizellomyces punctatus (strain DAOM BR117) TaxID=645134 RepID=A0A0L0HHN9_SPIPD|nr:small GTP-binding protein domain [Spizellomyces punctatus DAOM BR117]KND00380.1 small GTP-binding protein domain [Spizellomyces punctatus DAOM BR117]|eukprot:XP_016608419.1 small GTP-binding protein domain [Spizellomyces punctatus DAOM BR117]
MSATQAKNASEQPADLKIILLGDSAVGKSKLAERFLLDEFHPQQLSTYALTLYRHVCTYPFPSDRRSGASTEKPRKLRVDFWDTAGQERFQSMHAGYYHGAHACILVFDVGRKITYKNLDTWYDELVSHVGLKLPVIVVANKIDVDPSRAKRAFGFVERRRAERAEASGTAPQNNDPEEPQDPSQSDHLPLFFASASDGTNVVSIFREAINRAVKFKEQGEGTFVDEVLAFIREEEGKEGGLFAREDEGITPSITAH